MYIFNKKIYGVRLKNILDEIKEFALREGAVGGLRPADWGSGV